MILEKIKSSKVEIILLVIASLFIAYKTNQGYWIGGVSSTSADSNPFVYLLAGLGESGFAFYGFNAGLFFGTFLVALGLSALILFAFLIKKDEEERNRVGHEHGKKHIGTEKDKVWFRKKFMEEDNYNILFSKTIGLSMNNRRTNRTTNVLVIGGTGTGKTFRYIKPNILQLNSSKIITDPSGDLFRSFGEFLMAQGKNVYIFNVKDMSISNFYNPLLNVYDAEGKIDPQKVDVLVDLYMDNASEGNAQGGSDPFWPKSEKAFLTGVIYYVLENDGIPKEEKCFNTVLKYVQKAKATKNEDQTALTKEIKSWQEKMEREGRKIMTPLYYDTFLIAPEKTANTILITTAVDLQIFSNPNVDRITRWTDKYPFLNINIDDIAYTETYLFLSIPQEHKAFNFLVAMLYSQIFGRLYNIGESITTDKWFLEVKKGFPLVDPFDTKEQALQFKEEISEKDIESIDHVNGTQVYVLNWHNKVYKKSFVRETLVSLIDEIKKSKPYTTTKLFGGDPALPMAVQFMLDEFKNIGEIPNFETIISTCRKYRIGCHVVIQDIAQLKEMYPDDAHQTILANVDTTLFLGSILTDDKEEIQRMLGKTTIKQRSTSSSKQGGSVSWTPTEVDLMSMDEIGAINEGDRNDCIVIIRDVTPFVEEKLNMYDHPNAHLLEECEGTIDCTKPFRNTVESRAVDIVKTPV